MKIPQRKKMRIISLAPSATSILCAIGAKILLVGVTPWCKEVAAVGHLPQVGDCWSGDPAELLALHPTLVIGSVPYKQETVARLLEHPLTFLAMNPRSLAGIESDIRLLGRIVDRAAAADKLAAQMRREFATLAKKSQRVKHRPRVYCESWPNPRISSPPWVAEMVKIAGGAMAVPAGQRVTDAQVAEAQPEVIVLAWAATGAKAKPEKAYAVAAWKDLPAIRDKRVYVISDELLNTPGPPLLAGARELSRILQQLPARQARA
ncbi:MAG: ABC transporter substrate-binding protein [Acidobacteriia bacterium]|nr:ABC transporter substrate-binding protein [Terriglobia bacterium]